MNGLLKRSPLSCKCTWLLEGGMSAGTCGAEGGKMKAYEYLNRCPLKTCLCIWVDLLLKILQMKLNGFDFFTTHLNL